MSAETVVVPETIDGIPIKKLYVANLPSPIDKRIITNIFRKYGTIEDIIIVDTSNYCYAFVTFKNTNDALSVLKNRYNIFFKKKLRISPADSWHQPDWGKDQHWEIPDNANNINILNNDCLLQIFKLLNYSDRLNTEQVCIRWRSLCNVLWASEKHLSLDFVSWGSWDQTLSSQIFRSMIVRCGYSLTSVDISAAANLLNVRTLQVISNNCPNLTRLNISGLRITAHGVRSFIKHITNLQTLQMNGCEGLNNNNLSKIVAANPSLRTLSVANNEGLRNGCIKECFPNVNVSLISLDVSNCNHLDVWTATLTNLRELRLDCVYGAYIQKIAESLPNLENLSLCRYSINTDINALGELSQLKVLKVSLSAAVSDTTLKLISQGCRLLHTLNVSCCNAVTSAGLCHLTKLPALKILFVNYIEATNSTALRALAANCRLTHLQARGCPNVTDESISSFLSLTSNSLIELDISGCRSITNAALTELLNSQRSTCKLTLVLGGTSVAIEALPQLPPDIVVSSADYCISQFRPQNLQDMILNFPNDEDFDSDDFNDTSDDSDMSLFDDDLMSSEDENLFDYEDEVECEMHEDFLNYF